ncbi:MAG: Maf family nucleotide pyrophosphatase [Pseudomonadota bacterium]|nr:Maf family nucleotide pyrophosphatase [Pseudomonadota bacterium]
MIKTFKTKETKPCWGLEKPFILASSSPRRIRLLENAGFKPAEIVPADIDETEKKGEKPDKYVVRVATEKARHVANLRPKTAIVAADTIIVAKGKIVRKAPTEQKARSNFKSLSGGTHYAYTGYCIISETGKEISKLVKTTIKTKKFTDAEIDTLIASKEWQNVAAYGIEGLFSALVKDVQGSYTNIIGLPVYEVSQDLRKILK